MTGQTGGACVSHSPIILPSFDLCCKHFVNKKGCRVSLFLLLLLKLFKDYGGQRTKSLAIPCRG